MKLLITITLHTRDNFGVFVSLVKLGHVTQRNMTFTGGVDFLEGLRKREENKLNIQV